MRGITMTVLALCAFTTAAEAASSKTQPKAPAPEVVIPREAPADQAPSSASAAPSNTKPAPTVETVTIPAESAAPSSPQSAPAQASSSPVAEEGPAKQASAPAEAPLPTPAATASASTPTRVADATPVSAPTHTQGFGADTRYWTSLQVSGASAVKEERPIPGEVATKNYERYLKSFDYAIPEKFVQESFSSGGGSGSGGGGSR